jgi:hypothetical protein
MKKEELARRVALENFNTEIANAEIKKVKEHFSKFIGKKVVLANGAIAKVCEYKIEEIVQVNENGKKYVFEAYVSYDGYYKITLRFRSWTMGDKDYPFTMYSESQNRYIGEIRSGHLKVISEDWYPELMDVDTIFNAAQKAKEIAEEYKKEVEKVPYVLRAGFYLENLR